MLRDIPDIPVYIRIELLILGTLHCAIETIASRLLARKKSTFTAIVAQES